MCLSFCFVSVFLCVFVFVFTWGHHLDRPSHMFPPVTRPRASPVKPTFVLLQTKSQYAYTKCTLNRNTKLWSHHNKDMLFLKRFQKLFWSVYVYLTSPADIIDCHHHHIIINIFYPDHITIIMIMKSSSSTSTQVISSDHSLTSFLYCPLAVWNRKNLSAPWSVWKKFPLCLSIYCHIKFSYYHHTVVFNNIKSVFGFMKFYCIIWWIDLIPWAFSIRVFILSP